MIPADDGTGGGASADRGDDWTPTTEVPPAAATTEETVEDDLKVATGEPATEEPPRDAAGKFAPKVKTDEGATIPKARFDSAVQKERERAETAERLLAEATKANNRIQRNADVSKLEADVSDLREQEHKALIQGDSAKARELASEADRLNRQIAIQQAGDMSAAAKDAALESMRMELAVENIETNYPQLDENSEEFDQDLTDDVLDKQRGYMERERLSPSKALLKAVKYVMGRQAPAAATEPAKTGLSAASKGQDRKSAAVAKNLDAAARQPASTKPVGADSDKHGQTKDIPEASQMTFAEFSALPDATKSKMRGDYV
jgi:hypothetical protein